MEVEKYVGSIREIINNGGPEPKEYDFLKNLTLGMLDLSLEEESKLHGVIEPILNINSMIGYTFHKPHGYAGDYELINRIYTKWKTSDNTQTKWDQLYHSTDSAKAVRNRKQYLINQVNKVSLLEKTPTILNIGSGPCTDVREYFTKYPRSSARFECLDMDKNAIEFGSCVCDNYIGSIKFINKNVFRFKNNKKYNLIWSAGLFDYFSDKLFVRLVNRIYEMLERNGELVIGNFSNNNPSRGLMEVLCKWYLHHRSEQDLIDLALKAGIPPNKIEVRAEETGVNLFLHLMK